jgi:hypothetical protein
MGEHRAQVPHRSGGGGALVLIEGQDVDDGVVGEVKIQDIEQDVLRREGVHLTKDDGERDDVICLHEAITEATNRRCQAEARDQYL